MEMSNAVIAVIVALLTSLGANTFIIKYVLPKIQLRIDNLEEYKATALTKDQMKDILDTNNKLMKEMFKNLVLELELKLKD